MISLLVPLFKSQTASHSFLRHYNWRIVLTSSELACYFFWKRLLCLHICNFECVKQWKSLRRAEVKFFNNIECFDELLGSQSLSIQIPSEFLKGNRQVFLDGVTHLHDGFARLFLVPEHIYVLKDFFELWWVLKMFKLSRINFFDRLWDPHQIIYDVFFSDRKLLGYSSSDFVCRRRRGFSCHFAVFLVSSLILRKHAVQSEVYIFLINWHAQKFLFVLPVLFKAILNKKVWSCCRDFEFFVAIQYFFVHNQRSIGFNHLLYFWLGNVKPLILGWVVPGPIPRVEERLRNCFWLRRESALSVDNRLWGFRFRKIWCQRCWVLNGIGEMLQFARIVESSACLGGQFLRLSNCGFDVEFANSWPVLALN